MNKKFELLSHTADIKIRVYGTTLADLMRNAVVSMFLAIKPQAPGCTWRNEELICPELPRCHEIALNSVDLKALLVDFLSEVLYMSDVHNEAYLDATIEQVNNTSIKATLHGVAITGFEVVEIKAVTYHDLKIEQRGDHWVAEIVFDI